MNCLDLFRHTIAEFVEEFRTQRDRLLVFQHVPKTAGCSVGNALSRQPAGFLLEWDQMDKSWAEFLALYREGKVAHVRGHMWNHHLADLENRSISFHAVCFLRHPIDRLVSHFLYDQSPANPNHLSMIERFPTFELFCEDYVGRNFMTGMMVGHCDSIDQAIQKIENRFTFVGLTEHYHAGMSILMRCLGCPYQIRPRVNVTQSTQVKPFAISDAFRQKLINDNVLDVQLFEYFQARYNELNDASWNSLSATRTKPQRPQLRCQHHQVNLSRLTKQLESVFAKSSPR